MSRINGVYYCGPDENFTSTEHTRLTLIKYIAHLTLLVATAFGAEPLALPRQLGDFTFVEDRAAAVGQDDQELYAEYQFDTSISARYSDSHSRSMVVDAFRFKDALGAHAAFLASRPRHGVSPMIWHIEAVTGDGATMMEYHNYVLRFSGALPTVSSALEEMLAKLPGVNADEAPWDVTGRYLDPGSTRMLLGPISLARFENRIPPSIAAFRLGAKGRMGAFETPAGRMTEIVLEYPDEATASDRLAAIAGLPQAVARLDRTCVGVVLEPLDTITAQELLTNYFCGPITFAFNPNTLTDGPMTLGQGIWVAIAGFILGAVVVIFRRVIKKQNKPPDRMIPLDR